MCTIASSIGMPKLGHCDPFLQMAATFTIFGLSIERPILDHHPKAHVHEIWQISWNPVDFTMKSSGFHHDIWRISWNLVDFTIKSGGFHEIHEIWQISGEIQWISWNLWNLADFTPEIRWISPRYHLWNPPKIIKASVSAKTLQFDECRVGDFTMKSGGFHLWNPPKIIKASVLAKTLQFDECRVGAMTKDFMKSTRFHPEVWWISPTKSGRFHPDFTCEIHPNYKSKCFSKNSSVWWMQGRGYDQGFHEICQISPWNLADLTCEIQWISPRYHLWNPPKIIKASVSAKNSSVWWMQDGGFHPWNPMDFTLKSGGFHPWNLADFTCEIHPKL